MSRINESEIEYSIGDLPNSDTTNVIEMLAHYTFELELRIAALEMKLARLLDAVPSAATPAQPAAVSEQPVAIVDNADDDPWGKLGEKLRGEWDNGYLPEEQQPVAKAAVKLSENMIGVLRWCDDHGGITSIDNPFLRIGRGSNLSATLEALKKRGLLEDGYELRTVCITPEGMKALRAALSR